MGPKDRYGYTLWAGTEEKGWCALQVCEPCIEDEALIAKQVAMRFHNSDPSVGEAIKAALDPLLGERVWVRFDTLTSHAHYGPST
jgi:hypothetical protein